MSNISDANYAEMCKNFPILNVFAQLQIICTHLFSIRHYVGVQIFQESHRRAPRKLACMQAGMQAGFQRAL